MGVAYPLLLGTGGVHLTPLFIRNKREPLELQLPLRTPLPIGWWPPYARTYKRTRLSLSAYCVSVVIRHHIWLQAIYSPAHRNLSSGRSSPIPAHRRCKMMMQVISWAPCCTGHLVSPN